MELDKIGKELRKWIKNMDLILPHSRFLKKSIKLFKFP